MSMSTWAENEVRIACERENPNRKEGEFDYGCACYESALKAFKCLMEDGHSGMSIGITRQILNRLLLSQPLTPIEDADDIWTRRTVEENVCTYQCKRMSSLFKYKYYDGSVKYTDVDRIACYNVDSPNIPYHFGVITRLIDEMFPITMPYVPSEKPFKVYTKEFLIDPKNGDFDMVAVFEVIKPDGERVEINRLFGETEDGWAEIPFEEFEEKVKEIAEREEKTNGREDLEQTGEIPDGE